MGPEKNLEKEIESKAGVLRLKPNFVARTFYPGLNRLGLENAEAGERGAYVERWIASCVESAHPTKVLNEGLSQIVLESSGSGPTLRDGLNALPGQMLGENYARSHGNRFGALAKVLDIGYPIQWHIHARKDDAWRYWKSNPKDEAYFFVSHANSPGPVPYSHIGMHPGTTPEEVLEPLKRWHDDKVLDLSPAYRLNIGEGFHVASGVPHAPGTALTLELQEESDVHNMLQAKYRGGIASKEAMLNGLPDEEAVVKLIDWETSTDPQFYRKFHTVPEPIEAADCKEGWVFQPWRTRKFSGKELRVGPGKKAKCRENGAHGILVWQGQGRVGASAAAAKHGLDEFFVTYGAATQGYAVENTGNETLVLYKLFGPDVNL